MLQGRALLSFITVLTASGFLLVGYDNGVLGGVINNEPFQTTFKNPSASLLGTIVAIYEIGCCVGSLITAVFGEALGRRRTIFIGAVVMLAGCGAQAGVSNVGGMIAARIISGLGMGAINSTVPVLMAEVSPKASRGRYVCAQLSTLNLGIFLAYWVGYGFSSVTGSKAWRIPVALQAVFIIPIIILSLLVPESPRWLISHAHPTKALDTIARLNAKSTTDPAVVALYEEMERSVEIEKSLNSGSWGALFSRKDDEIKSRRRLLIACFIQASQQLGGINGIIYYSGTVLATTGLSAKGASLVSGFLFTWFFVASFIPWFLIDRVGRRPLFLVCISLMACCFAAQAGLTWKVQTANSKGAGIGAATVLFIYMGLFTIGYQANNWVYQTEILSQRLRQKGSSLATATNWICNYAVVQVTPPGLQNIGYKYYIIYAVLNATWVPIIYFFFPETAGRSLEEIDLLFASDRVLKLHEKDDYTKVEEVLKEKVEGESDGQGARLSL